MKPATFISFVDGRCRHLRAKETSAQVQEAILACSATDTEANLLDADLTVVARCVRTAGAMDGFTVRAVTPPAA